MSHAKTVVQISIDSDNSTNVLVESSVNGQPIDDSVGTFPVTLEIPNTEELRHYLGLPDIKFDIAIIVNDPAIPVATEGGTDYDNQTATSKASVIQQRFGVYCYKDGAGKWKCIP